MTKRAIAIKYLGPRGQVWVDDKPLANGAIITQPPETVAEFCSRSDCEPIYELPEDEGPPAASSEEPK